MNNWIFEEREDGRVRWTRHGYIANNRYTSNAFEVEETFFIGAGPGFGWTEEDKDHKYPALTVRLAFTVDEKEKRSEVARAIMNLLDSICMPPEEQDEQLSK